MKLTFLLVLFFATSVAFSQSIETYVSSLSKVLANAKSHIYYSPYRREHHDAFLNYFNELGEFIDDMNESQNHQDRFQNYLSAEGISGFCKRILLHEDDWKSLMSRCTKNRFFLCADEVKEYGHYKQSLKRLMTPKQQSELSRLIECQ